MDKLSPDKLFGPTPDGQIIGCRGEIHRSVTSTMDVAREKAGGVEDGHVVFAEVQTQGRGRDGHWICSPGQGLLLTVVCHTEVPPRDRCLMSLIGPLAATETLRSLGVTAQIKWPNDIVTVETEAPLSLRKIGGTLVEQCSHNGRAPSHLLGLGLNVNQKPEQLEDIPETNPTSLRIERDGKTVDRNGLGRDLLENLDRWYACIRAGSYAPLRDRWHQLNCLRGKRIRVQHKNRILTGKVTGVDPSGELILETEDHQKHILPPQTTTVLGTGQVSHN